MLHKVFVLRRLTIALIVLACLLPNTAIFAQTSFPTTGVILLDANLRDGAGTNFAIVGSGYVGQQVTIIETNSDGTWYRLENGGWIAAFLVEIKTVDALTVAPTVAPSLTPTGARAKNSANLRSGPGTSFPVVDGVQSGQVLTIVSQNVTRDWYQLDTGNWIAAFLVEQSLGNVPITSVPLLSTLTANERDASANYAHNVIPIMDTYVSAFQQLEILFSTLSNTPTLILVDEWKVRVALQLALMRAAGNDVRDLQAPVSMQPIQYSLLKAAEHYDTATILIAEGIDEIDSLKLGQVSEYLAAGYQALEAASSLAEQMVDN